MKNSGKNLVIWLIIFAVIMTVSQAMNGPDSSAGSKLNFSDFMKKVDAGEVAKVEIKGNDLVGQFKEEVAKNEEAPKKDEVKKDPIKNDEVEKDAVEKDAAPKKEAKFYTYLPEYPNLVEVLQKKGVEINIIPLVSKSEKVIAGILGWLPFILLIALWIFLARGSSGGAGGRGGAFGFGRSRAKLLQESKVKVTFADVAGIDEAKQELSEIVDFLKDAKKYTDVGAKIPRGCLLIGSPGTGKTLLARAIAGEASVPFFSISGSDFVEMFVGVGASRVRDMFEQAKKSAPCIVFIDEIDAVGRHRGSGIGGGNDEREQTLNQMLVEMDGFSDNEGVVIIAATNRPDVLDRALLRPGRFDRQITVPNPDILGREQILAVHLRKVAAASDIDPKVIARGTPGFAGADLANLVNEGALMAARKNQRMVTMQNLEDAKDKIMMGTERKSMVMMRSEKELTAYHEAGHAITALNCKHSDPIHKATIIPRGRALGLVMRLPETDRFSVTRAKLHDDIVVAMGGRAAEELIFGHDQVTTGASSDISQATNMARGMVTRWGLSDKVGPIDYAEEDGSKFYAAQKTFSEETGKVIDDEVKKIITDALQRAKEILNKKKDDLEKLAQNLLEFETLTGDEIKDLLAGKKIRQIKAEDSTVATITQSLVPKVSD